MPTTESRFEVLSRNADLLGIAIGRCLARSRGLVAAYTPHGVGPHVAETIVRAINATTPSSPPRAILVTQGPFDEHDLECPKLSTSKAIMYRQGNRVAVVEGRHPDLASFVQAFVEGLGPDYPKGASGVAGINRLAEECTRLVLESAQIAEERFEDLGKIDELHRTTLVFLADVYEKSGTGTLSWNSYWYRHIANGMQSLVRALAALDSQDSRGTNADKAMIGLIPAAYSLPTGIRNMKTPAVASAVNEWWSDRGSIENSIDMLAHHPDTPPNQSHALHKVDWERWDSNYATFGQDHPFLAMHLTAAESPDHTDVFQQFTGSQFEAPNGAADSAPIRIELFDTEIDLASLLSYELPHLIPFEPDPIELDGNQYWVSRKLQIRIPTLGRVSSADLAASNMTVVCKPARFEWRGDVPHVREGVAGLWMEGRFWLSAKKRFVASPVTVSMSVPAHDVLHSYVDPSNVAKVVPLPPVENSVLLFNVTGNRLGSPRFYQPAVEGAQAIEISSASSQVVVAHSGSNTSTFAGTELERWEPDERFACAKVTPQELDRLEIGTAQYDFHGATSATAPQSPIIAAIDRSLVASEASQEARDSLRGQFENLFAEVVDEDAWLSCLGHLVAPSSPHATLGASTSTAHHVLAHTDFIDDWSAHGHEISGDLLGSQELARFIEAYKRLDIRSAIEQVDSDGDVTVRWPSSTSWRHLWDERREQLDAYLETYAQLVEHARDLGDSDGVFWASYPHSISVWDEENFRCEAVLLSPLHPLRLAWLASTESAIWEDESTQHLAGLVEGWNWPLLGPSNTKIGKLLAVPSDSGPGEVFLGWSMLVRASVDGPGPLSPPALIAGMPAPGTASSGLNKSAVTGALKTYQRINPHVTTLVMDLAAASTSPRLEEMDAAVLEAAKYWNRGSATGIRIHDSLHRLGEPPFEELAEIVADHPSTPVTWSRYGTEAPPSNMRFLQDPGAHVEVTVHSGNTNSGVSPSRPLRRFTAPVAHKSPKMRARSFPAVGLGSGWPAWFKALQAVEESSAGNELTVQLAQGLLTDGRADWTVTGETLLDPSALAQLISRDDQSDQMLWEWHPPMLSAGADQLLDRRPYVSVVQVPESFRQEIRKRLHRASHGLHSDLQDVMRTLGTRGIGLSSLIAMGGTHAAGALGFYLSIRLYDLFVEHQDNCDEFFALLPIDAIDSFLQGLAGLSGDVDSKRRADLLLLALRDDNITLTPIEIKMYGLGSKDPILWPSDSSLAEATEQAAATYRQIASIASRAAGIRLDEDRDSGTRALWFSALASLAESAFKLQPIEADRGERLAELLLKLAEGDLEVEAGRPVINYYRANEPTEEPLRYEFRNNILHEGIEIGCLTIDAALGFKSVAEPDPTFREDLTALLRWAIEPVRESRGLTSETMVGVNPKLETKADHTDSKVATQTSTRTAADPHLLGSKFKAAPVQDNGSAAENEPVRFDSGGSRPEACEELSLTRREGKPDFIVDDGVRFVVGNQLHALGNAAVDFWPSNTSLNHMNMGVVGDLGTGKTQLLKALITQLRTQAQEKQPTPISMLVFDYKSDFRDQDFLDIVGGQVYKPYRIPLNVLALNGRTPWQRAKSFTDILVKIYSNIGPVQKDRLANAIMNRFSIGDGTPGSEPLLKDVLDEYLELSDGRTDSVSSILTNFVMGEVFSAEREELKSFDELIEDTVLIIGLSELGTDQDSKNAVVALFLNAYYEYMHTRPKWPYEGQAPQLRRLNSFLLIDEASNIMRYGFEALTELLVQGREFGIGVILSSQFLSHFKVAGVNYTEPLRTWFIHKVPLLEAKDLRGLGVTDADELLVSKVQTQNIHECFYRSLDANGTFIRATPYYELRNALGQ